MDFSAFSVLSFCRNQHLLQISGHPEWLVVKGRSCYYVNKLRKELEMRGSQIKIGCEVYSISTSDKGCVLFCDDGSKEVYDGCIIAVPPPSALKILGEEATSDEMRILGAFQYIYSETFLHRDTNFMPQNPTAWSAWNFLGGTESEVYLTYWMNLIQNIRETSLPFFVSLNPPHSPQNVLHKWSTSHLVPSVAATKASQELDSIQGRRGIWFCGAYHGYGFHEDGLKAGMIAAHAMLGRSFTVLLNPRQMVPSWRESVARNIVVRYLKRFISAGHWILLEDGGTVITFGGSDERCMWRSALRVQNPQFYWKVATEFELGFADAFISGDISAVDKNNGLLNLFMIFIVNTHLYPSTSAFIEERGWWQPMLLRAGIASAKYYFCHLLRQNSVRQAGQNISRHYDLSNEMFSFFLDETMTYSCAIFKSESEDLKAAQLRKIHLLIEKARVEKHHELLDVGCGWGTLAIEVVKKTGCRYTGITLSEEQLKLAEQKVKEAGLEDRKGLFSVTIVNFQLFISAIESSAAEHVGDEYYEEFFRRCESLLADDGLLVLQFISVPDQWYERRRRSAGFLTEYIFPGGCLPSLSRLTKAMTTAFRLCVEHVENIGIHYFQTLRCWRKNFLDNQSKILLLGFDDKFIRTREYFFDYCAAGFKTRTLGDYQIVLSRPGNLAAFSDPYLGIPSAQCC